MPKILDDSWPDDAAVEAAAKADYEHTYRGDRWQDAEAHIQERHRREVLPLLIAARDTAPDAGEWQDIESAPKGRKVIVGYMNDLGNWRTVMGCYIEPRTLEANTDYIDGDDDGYAPEGWYEDGEAYSETLMPTDKPPTHWRPLPAPPALASRKEG